jgi:hypothetical protein
MENHDARLLILEQMPFGDAVKLFYVDPPNNAFALTAADVLALELLHYQRQFPDDASSCWFELTIDELVSNGRTMPPLKEGYLLLEVCKKIGAKPEPREDSTKISRQSHRRALKLLVGGQKPLNWLRTFAMVPTIDRYVITHYYPGYYSPDPEKKTIVLLRICQRFLNTPDIPAYVDPIALVRSQLARMIQSMCDNDSGVMTRYDLKPASIERMESCIRVLELILKSPVLALTMNVDINSMIYGYHLIIKERNPSLRSMEMTIGPTISPPRLIIKKKKDRTPAEVEEDRRAEEWYDKHIVIIKIRERWNALLDEAIEKISSEWKTLIDEQKRDKFTSKWHAYLGEENAVAMSKLKEFLQAKKQSERASERARILHKLNHH